MLPVGRMNIVCDRCALFFTADPFVLGVEAPDGTVGGVVKFGPCPRCGGQGTVVSARHGRSDHGEHVVMTTNYDAVVELLARLQQEGPAGRISAAEAAAELEKVSPSLAPLAAWLRRNEHLATWLSVVLAVLALMLSQNSGGMTADQLEQVIDRVVENQAPAGPSSVDGRPGRAPARNAPCWCGSGMKFKHCHGRPGTAGGDNPVGEQNSPGD